MQADPASEEAVDEPAPIATVRAAKLTKEQQAAKRELQRMRKGGR